MTDRSQHRRDRLTARVQSPQGGALLAALLTLAVLLPVWLLAIGWYRAELLSGEPGQRSLLIFEVGGLIVIALAAGVIYLLVNRQALLAQAVQERTREITRINHQLAEDLTRRHQIEEELRRSDERHRAVARSFPNGAVFLFDADLRYILADGAGLAEVGLSKEMLEGLTIWEALAPETVAITEPHYRAALAGEPHVFEADFGGHVYLSRTLPLRDDRGAIIAGMAITQDITERKRAEQSLHRWAHIFEHAEWGVAIGSADGRTLEMMNPAYAKMHGFTVEELSGMPIGSVFAPGTAAELSELIRAANETGHAVMESKHVRKDGTIFPVQVDLTAVKDENGQLLYRVANVQDITDRKQAEDEVRRNEARLRVLVEQMPALLWTMDTDLRFTSSSGAALSELGLQPQAVVGRNLRDFAVPDDAEFAKIFEMHQCALRGESVSYESLRRGRNIQNHLEPLRNTNGDIIGCIGVGLDLTERKQAEAQLRTSEAELRALFAAMPDVILVLDAQGRYLRIAPTNPSFSRRPAENLLGQTLQDVFAPDEAAEFLGMIQTALRTQQPVQADYSLTINDEVIWYTATISPMPNDTVLLVARDITARKRSEEAWQRSQQQYEQLVNSIEGIVWEGDAQTGRFTFVSPAAERMLGYPIAQWLTEASFWVDRLHPEDRDWVVAYCAAETAALRPHECEYRMLAADGRNVWLRETVTVMAEGDRPKLLRGMLLDITARKQAEEALREREEQYRSIFEASLDGLFINSLDGYVIDVNPAGARMHGYTVEECRGLRSELLVPADRLAGLQEFINTARSGGQFRARGFDRRKDGSLFPIDVVGTQFIYRGQSHALAIVRDNTETVKTEQAMQERELQYRSVFESSLDGLAINNLDGDLVEFNPAMAHMHGYTVEEFRHIQPPQFVHTESLPLFATFMETIRAGREYRCRAIDVRKDGSLFHIEVIGTPFTLRGQPHAFAIVRDINAQVEAEEALREREAQYRSIFEAVSDGLFIDTIDGEMIDFNPAVAHMHGYTVEEFRQIPTIQIIHPNSLHLFKEFVDTVKSGGQYRCRAIDVRKDGSLFPVEVTGTPITVRGQQHLLAVLHDITTQVEAERLLEQRVVERTRELSTLLDVSRNIASTLEIEPLLGLILDALKVFVDYTSARINTLEGQVLRVRAARGQTRVDRKVGTEFSLKGQVAEEVLNQQHVLVIPDVNSPTDPWAITFRAEGSANLEAILAHARSWMGVPLIARGRVIGNLSLEHEQPGFYDAHHAEVVLALADQVAVALENARLFTEAQGKAVLEERQRLARDLHDSVTQSLYSLTLLAEASRRLIDSDVPQSARYLNDMGEIAQQSLKEMRLLVYQLRPLALAHEGLIGAVQARLDSVEKRAGIEARFLIEGNLGDLTPAIEEGLFRIAQEALNNALKHAAARSVVVRLHGADECVTLEVTDNGRGSALLTSNVNGGLGLTSIKERVAQLHGVLTIDSAPGQGTRISVEVPR